MGLETLKLKRFLQHSGCCALAAAASVTNFYNKKINYQVVYDYLKPDGAGMYTPDIAILLNDLGFGKVTVISADIHHLDYDWAKLSRSKMIEQLKKSRRYNPDFGYRQMAGSYVKFLDDRENDNKLIIDHHFGTHIRHHLALGQPVLASFNWNLFFKHPKWNDKNQVDAIKGDFEEHEVVIYGCDEKGVKILDSHHEMYKGNLSKYRTGRYKIDWETLHTVMGFGDLIIPEAYDETRTNALV